MIILDNIITDRGSKYAVSGGLCRTGDEARSFLAELKRNKRFSKATHNSWSLICDGQMIKNDDGEAGAGMVILRMLKREGLRDHIVVVTRWFGGKHLGGDRYRHVQEAVRIYIRAL
jgi:putative IMPACT (imprinted ancient) family translation regulator